MARKDPVTAFVAAAVLQRDGGCVGPRVGMKGPCDGRLELDHILNGGMAWRGPSTIENLVSLCTRHHRIKTENARWFRPLLIAWVDSHE